MLTKAFSSAFEIRFNIPLSNLEPQYPLKYSQWDETSSGKSKYQLGIKRTSVVQYKCFSYNEQIEKEENTLVELQKGSNEESNEWSNLGVATK